jgi:hypothetical protein
MRILADSALPPNLKWAKKDSKPLAVPGEPQPSDTESTTPDIGSAISFDFLFFCAFGVAGGCEPKPVQFFRRGSYPAADMGVVASDDLFRDLRNPAGTRVINERCLLRTQDGHCVVIVSGMVLAQYGLADRTAEAYARVNLVERGWAMWLGHWVVQCVR